MYYHVLHVSPDGDVSAETFTKEELEKRLNENYWGTPYLVKKIPDSDVFMWPGGEEGCIMIIKGEIVVPRDEKIVVRRSLP